MSLDASYDCGIRTDKKIKNEKDSKTLESVLDPSRLGFYVVSPGLVLWLPMPTEQLRQQGN
jgi:hypothetical protein